MKIKRESKNIETRLENICVSIETIVEIYSQNFAEYGWDNFTETLANVSAQLYMMRVMIHNAEVIDK
ncbi:MAG: hypothetical protein UHU21_02925 [Lachnospiraceae bacterium]|nr:hypothetical protein [Lachnospiraceae bacterium]